MMKGRISHREAGGRTRSIEFGEAKGKDGKQIRNEIDPKKKEVGA